MTAFVLNASNEKVDVPLDAKIYLEAADNKMSVETLINQKFGADINPKFGTAFEQTCASVGLILPAKNEKPVFGARSPFLFDILDGKSMAANTEKKGSPFGAEARSLFPAFVISQVEDVIQPDRVSDDRLFRSLSATTVPVNGDVFLQPVLSFGNAGGANNSALGAKAARVTQMAQVPTVLFLGTSEKPRNIPTYGVGVEMSDKALQNTTLDLFQLTMNRFFTIEKDARVYTYMSNLFAGDLDHNTGAVSAVTTTSLDASATGGVVTHKAWLKFLAGGTKRKKRKVTVCIADLDTYMKVEARTGRPGSNNYDPTLARIDPQAKVINNTFGADVKWIIVDDAANGGPVPANTIWAMDETMAFMIVTNTQASYTATEQFVLSRKSAAVWHWSEEVFRLFGDNELTAFDVLTIL